MFRRGLFLSLFIAISGCSQTTDEPGTVKIRGDVTNAGEPLHVEGREVAIGRVTIGFCRIYEDGEPLVETTSADVAEDGSFELIDGIEPGKYLITVRQWDPFPSTDRLKGAFDEKNSKIVRELAGDEQELNIDVARPEG